MERKLSETYNSARDELTAEWQAFMQKQEPRVKQAYEDLQAALQTGDTQTIFDARVYYERVMMNTTIQNNRYQNMVDDLTNRIANVNQMALDYLNGNMPYIYTINYNQFATERIKGYSFSLINENAVRELMVTNKLLVPTKKKMDIPKDKRWNAKFINSQVTQGILKGESMQEIANRILPEIVSKSSPDLIKRNKAAAMRNARTMTTAAENKGRQDSFEKATNDGVIMEREWIAAHDERTRDWHRKIHGVRVAVDQPWENVIGKIMYPGDPAADPANVYNCRCAIRAHVKGFAWNQNKVESKPEELHGDQISADMILMDCEDYKLEYNQVKELEHALTEEEIIQKVAGGDKTKGSCVSASLAYCANKLGLDVTDFRGGKSQDIFSSYSHRVYLTANATQKSFEVLKECKETAEILKNLEKDKEFVLIAGRHAAVVRNSTEKGLQYLELQSNTFNGWRLFEYEGKQTKWGSTGYTIEDTLHDRFGCRKTIDKGRYSGKIYPQTINLVDVGSMQKTEEFKEVLGYLNTAIDKQKKGLGGGIK